MDLNRESNDLFHVSHLVLLLGYTAFALMHYVITFLLEWEKWPLILVAVAVITCWVVHIKRLFTEDQRLWIYGLIMMCNYFIYGTHLTSTYDLVIVMTALIMLFTMTGKKNLITMCAITYYITMTYDLVEIALNGGKFDILLICRITMHYSVMLMVAWIARLTIRRWDQVLDSTRVEIEALTDSTERLNDFLANVSHELRTPVNAVIGLSNMCIDKEDNPEIRNDMVEVRNAGRRIAEQIGDILDYSEMDSGNIVSNKEDYMLPSLLNDVMVELNEMKPDSLELIIDVDPAIPAVLNTDIVKMKKIIKSLVSNGFKYTAEGGVCLKIQSEKKSYGVNLIIEVADTGIGMSQEELERIYDRFYQSDSGRSRKSGGLGLGLGIVSGFVSLLGGFMTINSKPGVGTTVRVSLPQAVVDESRCSSINNPKEVTVGAFLDINKYLPRVRDFYNEQAVHMATGLGLEMHKIENEKILSKLADSLTHLFIGEDEYIANAEMVEKLADKIFVVVVVEPGHKIPENSKARRVEKPFYAFPIASVLNSSKKRNIEGGKQMKLSGVKVLVVDDEPMNLVVAKSIFKRYDVEVTTATSGPESIDICRKKVFDIIFMDHMMAGMDGVEAMRKIRSDAGGLNTLVPCIALTANAMSSAKQMFMAEGFDGFVSKPIELESLERAMKKVLPKQAVSYVTVEEAKQAEKKPAKKPEKKPADDDVMEFSPASDDEVMEFGPSDDEGGSGSDFDSERAALEEVGVNVQAGLDYCMGDSDFYLELLDQFIIEADERLSKLRKFYEEKDFKNYEILIHATKSNCKMIGIDGLSEDAKQLEKAAREGDVQYIDDNHARVIDIYDDLAGKIRSILA